MACRALRQAPGVRLGARFSRWSSSGSFAFTRLGVDRFPNVDIPSVAITTRLPGAAPEQVETEVTDKIEEAVNTISGIDILTSNSSEGVSQVVVSFVLEKDANVAAQEVRDKINRVLPLLPRTVIQPTVEKLDPTASPVLTVAVTAQKPLREITEYADKVLRRQLESSDGVGQVLVIGGRNRQINLWLNAELLRAQNLTVNDVARALQTQNVEVPGGRIDQGAQSVTLRTRGRIATVDEFGDVVIREVAGHPVRLRDVARVEDGMVEARTQASLNGTPTVLLQIRKQSGTNTVEVANNLKARLATLEAVAAARLSPAHRARRGRLHRGVDRDRRGAPRRRARCSRRSSCCCFSATSARRSSPPSRFPRRSSRPSR